MINKCLTEVKNILNSGINDNEELTREERIQRAKDFRNNLSYEKYSSLFKEIETCLEDDNVPLEEKEELILLTIECIRNFLVFENNIKSFPNLIVMLYESQLNLNRLVLLFEQIYYTDITIPKEYERIVLEYFDFLDNPLNEFYIQHCYSRIKNFNEKLVEYLDKTDYEGKKHKDNINNPELINLLNERINDFSKREV